MGEELGCPTGFWLLALHISTWCLAALAGSRKELTPTGWGHQPCLTSRVPLEVLFHAWLTLLPLAAAASRNSFGSLCFAVFGVSGYPIMSVGRSETWLEAPWQGWNLWLLAHLRLPRRHSHQNSMDPTGLLKFRWQLNVFVHSLCFCGDPPLLRWSGPLWRCFATELKKCLQPQLMACLFQATFDVVEFRHTLIVTWCLWR